MTSSQPLFLDPPMHASHTTRYIPFKEGNAESLDLEATKPLLVQMLGSNLATLAEDLDDAHHKNGSAYVGNEGIVLMCRYIASLQVSNTAALRQLSDASWTQLSSFLQSDIFPPLQAGARTSFLGTAVGSATLYLLARLDSSAETTAGSAAPFCISLLHQAIQISALPAPEADPTPGNDCEVLFCRAGLLYALLALRRATRRAGVAPAKIEGLAEITADDVLQRLVDDIVARGRVGAVEYARGVDGRGKLPGLMWSWHGKRYLGGAHGVAGVLQMLLVCPSRMLAPHLPVIVSTLDWLLALQEPETGNWPHKAPTPEPAKPETMVLWCHGAPAVLILLSTLLRRAAHSRTLAAGVPEPTLAVAREAMRAGAALAYRAGLLRGGVGLCHGVAGSVFTLLAVGDALGAEEKERCFRWAVQLALLAGEWQELTAEREMRTPDRPWSLYEGLAGMCCAWAALVARMKGGEGVGMPGYDDLGKYESE